MGSKKPEVDSNFTPVSTDPIYRLIWRSIGWDKTGKNHFGFTAPGPIFGQYFDPGGIEGVAEKFVLGKVPGVAARDIQFTQYSLKRSEVSQDDAKELVKLFIEDYEYALKHARTIQWDETEFWEWCRYAEFGENEQGVATDQPKNYARINSRYRDYLQRAYDECVNLQLIQKVKEKWGIDKKGNLGPIGQVVAQGFKQSGNIVQATLEHSWDIERGFVVKVVNCRKNMTLAGQEYVDTNFAEIATLVHGEESEGAWE